jgi:hypothetical protein
MVQGVGSDEGEAAAHGSEQAFGRQNAIGKIEAGMPGGAKNRADPSWA